MAETRFHSPHLSNFPQRTFIGNHAIGPGEPCYVIAEAGSNHDRSLTTALALVDAAADAGCNAVKFQSFTADELAASIDAPYSRLDGNLERWGSTLHQLYEACALPDEFHEPLRERAAERGIHFLSSPFSERQVDRLAALGVPALKIASFELVHLPLISYAASTGIPLILSTGMAGLGDIERALAAAQRGGNSPVILLHCGSSYPLDERAANLAAMATLRRAFGVPVGYSDHTLGIGVPIAAAALGCQVLEKHFTLSRAGDGPDHPFAVEPPELAEMVKQMRVAERAVGDPRKRIQPAEVENERRGRRSIFAATDLRAGQRITQQDLKIVRPGVGLEPQFLPLLIGRRLAEDVQADHPLQWEHILGPANR